EKLAEVAPQTLALDVAHRLAHERVGFEQIGEGPLHKRVGTFAPGREAIGVREKPGTVDAEEFLSHLVEERAVGQLVELPERARRRRASAPERRRRRGRRPRARPWRPTACEAGA